MISLCAVVLGIDVDASVVFHQDGIYIARPRAQATANNIMDKDEIGLRAFNSEAVRCRGT